MAPTEDQVKEQTSVIIKCLFDDGDEPAFRCPVACSDGEIEADGPDFDPVVIADKLKHVADAMNADARFQEALTDLKKAAAEEAIEAALEECVNVVCQSHVPQGAGMALEMQLIRATVAFGLFVKKSSPDLRSRVQSAMTSFLNKRVGKWVTQEGGWDKVATKSC